MRHETHHICREARQDEQGFALYMAIGFIVLISVLAGTVGNRLNTAIVSELRKADSQAVLIAAETALSEGWDYTYTQDGLDGDWLTGATGDSTSLAIADRDNCLATRDSNYLTFYVASATTQSDIRRRYFIRKDGTDYHIFGCGFTDADRRAAIAVFYASGGSYSLVRQRRY